MKFRTDAKWLERKLAIANDEVAGANGTSLEELKRNIDRRSITPGTIAAAPTELGKVVRFVRERKGLSRAELAEVARISEIEVTSIETQPDATLSPRALINLSDALELSRNRMKELAGFVRNRSVSSSREERFAAQSNRIDSISEDEYETIRALVEVLSEKQ
jgi:transcriptional regulator with XRE-family HTH domain